MQQVEQLFTSVVKLYCKHFSLYESQQYHIMWNVLYENGSCGFHFIT